MAIDLIYINNEHKKTYIRIFFYFVSLHIIFY